MPRTLSKQSRDQITAIIASARRGRDPGPLPGQRAAILRAYCEDVSENDLLSAEPAYLATAILSHLSWGRDRAPGRAKLRVFNPDRKRDGWTSDHTIVQAVNDNMPFLIDSMTMRLNELGRSVHRMMHPLLSAKRTRRGMLSGLAARGARNYDRFESYIQIEIGKELDASDLARIEAALTATLADVRAAVDDWRPMLSVLREAGEHVRQAQRQSEQSDEAAALIDWLADDHFTLLGYRRYSLRRGKRKDTLVPVAGTGLGILRDDPEQPAQRLDLVGGDQRAARARLPLLITKSRNRSTVHRSAYMDQISVKRFGERGNPIGVDRFVGLFTSTVYSERPLDIPMLRLKVAAVMRESGVDPKGHRGKALQHILDTLPRDDLFQISISDLARISFGILDLQETASSAYLLPSRCTEPVFLVLCLLAERSLHSQGAPAHRADFCSLVSPPNISNRKSQSPSRYSRASKRRYGARGGHRGDSSTASPRSRDQRSRHELGRATQSDPAREIRRGASARSPATLLGRLPGKLPR